MPFPGYLHGWEGIPQTKPIPHPSRLARLVSRAYLPQARVQGARPPSRPRIALCFLRLPGWD
jgi:hypothetical protein